VKISEVPEDQLIRLTAWRCKCVVRTCGKDNERGFWWARMFFQHPDCREHDDTFAVGSTKWMLSDEVVATVDQAEVPERTLLSRYQPYCPRSGRHEVGHWLYLWQEPDGWWSMLNGVYDVKETQDDGSERTIYGSWQDRCFGPHTTKEEANAAATGFYQRHPNEYWGRDEQ